MTAVAVGVAASPQDEAQAASINAADLLAEFGTIAIGDLTASSETERAAVLVGGDITTGGYTVNNAPGQVGTVHGVTGGLVVGGSVAGPINVLNGDAQIGGTAPGVATNNGTLNTGVSGLPSSADLATAFEELSGFLGDLVDTPGAAFDQSDMNLKSLTSGPGGTGMLEDIAVLNILGPDANFFEGGTLTGFSNTADTFIINVFGEADGDGAVEINVSGGFNQDDLTVLVNFVNATEVNVTNTFGFGILAPLADVSVTAGGLDGVVVGRNIVQGVEIRDTFDGTIPMLPDPEPPQAVPLPGAAMLLLGGLGVLAAAARRRSAGGA